MSIDSGGRKRVLLTGATGFVGRQIHHALLADGHTVRVAIRQGSAARLIAASDPAAVLESENLFDQSQAWWTDACASIDTLVHAAWFVTPGRYLSAPENLDCLSGSLTMARGAVEAGVGHIIGIGTCAEYRLPSMQLSVDSPLEPTTLYATAKLALYQTLKTWLHDTKVGLSWARLFYLHGPGEHPDRLAPSIRAGLSAGTPVNLSAGTQVRDFLDVRLAGAMIASVVQSRQFGAINICSSQGMTIRAFAERLAGEFGRGDLLEFGTAPPRPGDPSAVVGLCNLQSPREHKE